MIDRTQWISLLSTLPSKQLLAVTAALSVDWTISPKSLPQSGLGMLKLNDSAFDEPFYLGEFPMASTWLEIKTVDGLTAQGAAQVMDDRLEIVQALAICDAILSAKLPGWEQIVDLLEQGKVNRETVRQERKQMIASTQVNFSLLDDVDNDGLAETWMENTNA
ncbi:MAG: alpha-D-ribose 1-methylphosphonate 5-triphosphate synthase subunit PhnG [Arenicella sp.]|jgi:alpha-D-ribose 1-methylphosphonate 5-triphosphate synthase subunit PhnG